METQSVRVDKKLLKRVKRMIGKSKRPISAWINMAIENELEAQQKIKDISKGSIPLPEDFTDIKKVGILNSDGSVTPFAYPIETTNT